MGGGKKRKNPGVGVDFKRVKQKVGKKLPKAQNDTDTSFKAASINLPSQTLKEDREGVPVNSHNLTLKELLSQSSHYSEKARKGALIGMADLFSRHPQELTGHIGTVYSKLVERMADGDADVRKALTRLLREHCIPNIESGALRPFMPMIMAHVCSAMTHLSLQVRNDALMLLDVLMDHCPDLIVGGFLCPCIQHFCDLLSPGHRASSMKAQSLKVLLKVLHALTSFLRRAFPLNTSQASPSATPPSQSTTSLPHTTTPTANKPRPLNWDRTARPAGGALGAPPSLGAWVAHSAAPGAGTGSEEQKLQDLSVRLLQLLCNCWLECSPGQLRTAPELDLVQALLAILTASSSIVTNLIRLPPLAHLGYPSLPLAPHPPNLTHTFHISQSQSKHSKGSSSNSSRKAVQGDAHTDPAVGAVECLLQRVVPNFPATMPAVRPAPVVLEALAAYNLQAAQLLASFLPLHEQAQHSGTFAAPAAVGAAVGGGERAGASACSLGSPIWVEAVVSFFSDLLHGGILIPAAGMLSQAADLGDQAFRGGETGAYTVGNGGGSKNGSISGGKSGTGGNDNLAKGGKDGHVQGVPGGRGDSAGGGSHAAVYLGVLKSVGGVVGLGGGVHAGRLLVAVDALASRSASKSAVRAACLALQHDLLRRYQLGELYLDPCFPAAWLASLPKLLWELGSSSPTTIRVALSMLHNAARFCSVVPHSTPHPAPVHCPTGSGAMEVDVSNAEGTWDGTSSTSSSNIACTLAALQPQLAPLFAVQLPGLPGVKGAGSGGSKRKGGQQGGQEGGPVVGDGRGAQEAGEGASAGDGGAPLGGAQGGVRRVTLLAGPVTKLDAQLQELAVDSMYHMLAGGVVDTTLLKSLLSVLHAGLLPVPVAQRCVQVLMWSLPNMPPPTAASALLSLLFPLPTFYDVTGRTKKRGSGSSMTTQTTSTTGLADAGAANPTLAHHMAPGAPTGASAAAAAGAGCANGAQGHSMACWALEAQALADAVLGLVQAFAPAGLVLELLSVPLQARVRGELAGTMPEGRIGTKKEGGGDRGVGVGFEEKEARASQGVLPSKAGKGEKKKGREEKERLGVRSRKMEVEEGSIPAPGPPPPPQDASPGLTLLQLCSLITLAKMAAGEARAHAQPPATLHLHHSQQQLQQNQQQQQQQQQQQSPWPDWLQVNIPRLAVHACLRCVQGAPCPPAPVQDLAPQSNTDAQSSPAAVLYPSRDNSASHLTSSSGQASGVQGGGVQEMLEAVMRLVSAWPPLAVLVLEEVGRSAGQLWEGQQEVVVAAVHSVPATQQHQQQQQEQQQKQKQKHEPYQQALTAAKTLLALALSVLHQHAAVQQLLREQGRAHSALAVLTAGQGWTRVEASGVKVKPGGAAAAVWADAKWLKEVAHLRHVAERALGPAV